MGLGPLEGPVPPLGALLLGGQGGRDVPPVLGRGGVGRGLCAVSRGALLGWRGRRCHHHRVHDILHVGEGHPAATAAGGRDGETRHRDLWGKVMFLVNTRKTAISVQTKLVLGPIDPFCFFN